MAVFHALLWLSLVASLQNKLQPDILNQTWPRKSTIDEKSGDAGVLRHPEKTIARLPDSWRLGESNLLATHAKVSWSLFMVARSTRDHLKSHERFSVGMVGMTVSQPSYKTLHGRMEHSSIYVQILNSENTC